MTPDEARALSEAIRATWAYRAAFRAYLYARVAGDDLDLDQVLLLEAGSDLGEGRQPIELGVALPPWLDPTQRRWNRHG